MDNLPRRIPKSLIVEQCGNPVPLFPVRCQQRRQSCPELGAIEIGLCHQELLDLQILRWTQMQNMVLVDGVEERFHLIVYLLHVWLMSTA